jgi:hypothetical protein
MSIFIYISRKGTEEVFNDFNGRVMPLENRFQGFNQLKAAAPCFFS